MRFRLIHKLATYVLAATAFFTLAASGVLSTLTLGLVVLVGAVSWLADPETRLGLLLDRGASLLNIVTLLFLAVSVFQVARSFPDVDLSPFLSFVLFLLVYKLCQRRGNRDYLQIYVLSFLVMLAAAWTATSVVFVAGFAIYVVLATWTLILFHLRREIEENYIVRHASESQAEQVTATRVLNSRRVVGLSFFLTTGAVALVVLVGSSLVFAMVPRVGLGFLMGGVRRQIGIAGFSDEVRLGMHGLISTDNQTVVLRAQVATVASISNERDRDRVISSLYWRGTVYDTYDKGQWLRSREDKSRTQLSVTSSSADLSRTYLLADTFDPHPPVGRRAALLGAIEQTVEIVALSHPVAFAIDRPVAFELSPPPTGSFTAVDLDPRWSGEVSLRMFHVNPANPYERRQPMAEFMGASYRVYSRDASHGKIARATFADEKLAPDARDNYLRVPESLAPRVRDLATTIANGQPSPAAKVQAVVDWLKRTHGYTVDLKRDERIADPLEDFLFAEKAGHCEYFASAAAILLRLGGVPTRYVNGFLGGEWNDLRKVITVRENRAHSWVEAYLGQEGGWVRVDATPAVDRISHMGIGAPVARFRRAVLGPLGRRIQCQPAALARAAPRAEVRLFGPRVLPGSQSRAADQERGAGRHRPGRARRRHREPAQTPARLANQRSCRARPPTERAAHLPHLPGDAQTPGHGRHRPPAERKPACLPRAHGRTATCRRRGARPPHRQLRIGALRRHAGSTRRGGAAPARSRSDRTRTVTRRRLDRGC